MRALVSLSRLTRRLPASLAAVRAPAPLLLRHLHADAPPPPPPPPQDPPPFISRILESEMCLTPSTESEPEPKSDQALDEFLARFVAAFRPELAAAFPDHDRAVLDEMLRLVADAVVCRLTGADPGPDGVELSDDLWAAVWKVSASVQKAMRRDQVRADLRHYLHCDEVKEMTRFAVDVGIRGAMLRELRFKWAREKLEEVEFYRGLAKMHDEAEGPAPSPVRRLTALPKRKGEVKFTMYGLDMSDPKWAEVAERVAEAEAHFVPQEAKPIEGKAKKAEERLLSIDPRKGDPVPAMEEWKDELWPKRVDWLALLERVKARNVELYLKVAEILLAEESFEANIRDYSKLIDLHAKANNVEGAERILGKMKEKGVAPDILTSITLVHMYSNAGNLDQAKEAFEFILKEGFKPDMKLFGSMIKCYLSNGEPGQAATLMSSMNNDMHVKPTREMYTDVIRAYAQQGMMDGAQKVFKQMQLNDIKATPELFTLSIEAYGRIGDPDNAFAMFNVMRRSGHEPDDSSIAGVVAGHMKKNQLDQALHWLLSLEKEGHKPGVKTNLVLLDWLSMLQLVQEAEQLSQKIKQLGEEPIEVHVFLADMYAKLRQEEKARRSLKILEEKKRLLKADQFERIIRGLLDGGFSEEANKYYKMMKSCGFEPSETIEVGVKAILRIRGGPRPSGRH
ncbi:Pentatricopeptide repeat-containing protein [Dichanthelium oligosanthes]|uniref:Pentatricopeptide repeat-containing protein n=1 Tax=Dichanthelium oligosanthes TaxID=888268 RepID=A0A1E5VPV4_9POAL|nr:Pentatricopeptide repeat-containing protein [Dichanthelium oligosanthes]